MKNILLLSFVIFLLAGCKNPKSENNLADLLKDLKSIDSSNSKKIDSVAVNFKKWVDGKNNEYVHVSFIPEVKKELDYLSLKPKQKILSVIIRNSYYEGKRLIYPSFTRYNSVSDVEFSSKDINDFETQSSFRVSITTKNGDTTQIFKEREDTELLELITRHINDKIKIEEFFMREVTGHFEGDKELPVKNVRSFYLSDENKKALKESNSVLKILQTF